MYHCVVQLNIGFYCLLSQQYSVWIFPSFFLRISMSKCLRAKHPVYSEYTGLLLRPAECWQLLLAGGKLNHHKLQPYLHSNRPSTLTRTQLQWCSHGSRVLLQIQLYNLWSKNNTRDCVSIQRPTSAQHHWHFTR